MFKLSIFPFILHLLPFFPSFDLPFIHISNLFDFQI